MNVIEPCYTHGLVLITTLYLLLMLGINVARIVQHYADVILFTIFRLRVMLLKTILAMKCARLEMSLRLTS